MYLTFKISTSWHQGSTKVFMRGRGSGDPAFRLDGKAGLPRRVHYPLVVYLENHGLSG
ncbi:hypothetical protein ACRALDRAFT_2055963 [Sodiomyces alcalophilus JCM 7366]|uniref:uncharacterized protein n=1 Tax=Sodiomyces alcalophilus JCM 7366 TaxID=591952 RepID=UPI0039B398BC